MTVDPMQLIAMIKNGQNPQQLMIQILETQMQSSPMRDNLLDMARRGDGAGIEKIARNFAQQRGVDYDKEFNSFKQMLLGLK